MSFLFTVEETETGKARHWPEVTVPLSTMIRVQAPSTASQPSLEAGEERRQRKNGMFGKVKWFLPRDIAPEWQMREQLGVVALNLTATTAKALKLEDHSFDPSHHTQREFKVYIPLLFRAKWYNQNQTVVCLKDPKKLKMGILAFSQMRIQGFINGLFPMACSQLGTLSRLTFLPSSRRVLNFSEAKKVSCARH